jgi:predicted RNase H-like HicB family nuclease
MWRLLFWEKIPSYKSLKIYSKSNATVKYEIHIYWDAPDAIYVAEIPDLPGCMAHGSTYSEALANIEEASTLWLTTAQELGRAIPEPSSRLELESL